MRLKILKALLTCGALFPGVCTGQCSPEIGGSPLCRDQLAFTFRQGDFFKGVSLVSLGSQLTQWQSMPNEIVNVSPSVARDAVAFIAHSYYTIYGLSKMTGELLWQKENRSETLESDGKYFYVLGEDERALEALDPGSGNVVWSLKLPYSESRFYSHGVHDGRLYSASVVIDLCKKAIVHTWPKHPTVNALAFGEKGQILTGDEFGVVRIYDHSFRRLRKIRTVRQEVVEVATAGRNVLVSTEERRSGVYRAAFAVVTQQGKKRWQLAWRADYPIGASVALADRNVVLMEPDVAGDKYWLTSRKLATGQLNWKTDVGPRGGGPWLCGNTIYFYDEERIRSFDLRSGAETTVRK